MNFVKLFKLDCQRSLLVILILQFVFASFIVFNVNVEDVSAAPVPPCIKVVPETTFNSSITVGMNYTVAIVTDYNGTDIWSWQFSLTYDPDVLHGGVNITDVWTGNSALKIFYTTRKPVMPETEKVYVNQTLMIRGTDYIIDNLLGKITFKTAPTNGIEVKATYLFGVENGDLITKAKHSSATFILGQGFDNTVGKLSRLTAFFYYIAPNPPATTSGPGTLAYVTFTVVGTGYSNITLGTDTNLVIWDSNNFITKIDAATMPDHIGHGYFNNIPPVHDIAVSELVTPTTALLGDLVEINVTVRNEGNFTDYFNVEVYANDTTHIGTDSANLTSGAATTLTFSWNTTNAIVGKYTINATALLPEDYNQTDNSRTAQIEIKTVHDVTVYSVDVSPQVFVGESVPINVAVRNEGHFEENVTLDVSYKQMYVEPEPEPVVINSTNFLLAPRPASELVKINWNTADLAAGYYTINATATTIGQDEDPSDNTETTSVTLKLGHDVTVFSVTPTPRKVFVGELINIKVEVKNNGGYNETFQVKVTYNTTEIDTKSIESLPPGNLMSLQFPWITTGVAPSSYNITAEAILPGDVNQRDNKRSYRYIFIELPLGNISGFVLDANTDLPIKGTNVVAGEHTGTTNADGYYQISNVLAGNYTITASKDGYHSNSTTVTVEAGKTALLDFTLTLLQTTGGINGTVTDASTGYPIEGANVTTNGYYDTTDSNGNYNILNLPAASYTVTASKDGYESFSKTIVVEIGQTETADFELKPITQSDNTLYIALAAIGIIIVALVALAYFYRSRKHT